MGEEKKPLTREDVVRLIKKNGGKAEGLDLSRREFERRVDFRELNLEGIILKKARLDYACLEGANLVGAMLNEANFSMANLERASLARANLDRANLAGASLRWAWLDRTSLKGARLWGVEFSLDTKLENIDWGNYILGEEAEGSVSLAEDTYRRLKVWHTNAGIYDIAGEFFFREMEAKRKSIKWRPHPAQRKRIGWWLYPRHRTWSAVHSFVSGYGERPLRVARFGALVLFGAALLYFLSRGVAPYDLSAQAFLSSLYYSAVSFTALGYGPWFSDTSVRSWIQGAGAAEAFAGVFTIALFLVTFTRKMRR